MKKRGKINIYLDFILLLIFTLVSIIVFRMWSHSVFLVGKLVVEEGEAFDLCRLVALNIGKENYVRTGNIKLAGYAKEMHFLNLRVCADCTGFDEYKITGYYGDEFLIKNYISENKCPVEYCTNGIDDDGDASGVTDNEHIDEFYPNTDCGFGKCYVSCTMFDNIMQTSYPGLGGSVKMLKFETGNCADCDVNSCNCGNAEDDDGDGKINEYLYTSPGADYICGDEGKVCPADDFVKCDIPLYGTKETGKLTICALK